MYKGCVYLFEKNLNLGYLLDFYGELLNGRKRAVMDMYYNEDFSLSEIAEQIGISRQGVRDIIKKSEEELLFLEEKLGLAKKLSRLEKKAEQLCRLAEDTDASDELRSRINELTELIRQ